MKKKQQADRGKCPACGYALEAIHRVVMTEGGDVAMHITCSDAAVRRGEAVYIEPQAVRS